jgi:hypothetical protein
MSERWAGLQASKLAVSVAGADYLTFGTSEVLVCTKPRHLPEEILMLYTVNRTFVRC